MYHQKINSLVPLIAVVDDDLSALRALSRLIRSIGMYSATFSNGEEFVIKLEEDPRFNPDCVLLDLHMPDMNGLQVQEHVAKCHVSLPIIFITAQDDPIIYRQAMASGARDYLRKPIDDKKLVNVLKGALGDGTNNT